VRHKLFYLSRLTPAKALCLWNVGLDKPNWFCPESVPQLSDVSMSYATPISFR